MGPAARHVLEVVLILAISLCAIAALATLREPVVGVDHRPHLPGVSQVDTRWTPKWGTAAEVSAVGESAIVDTRWTAKERRAEDAAGIGSEARGSGAG
jgi:hypothetical protein